MSTTNTFTDKISNELTAGLPAIEFRGEIRIVDHERDIAAACKDLARHPVIGFDTETRPSFRPGVTYRVSLLQLSTPERCYLFRLNKIPLAKPILQLLEDRSVLKIGATSTATCARCTRSATSATAGSWICSSLQPNGASPKRACANSRPSCWANAYRKPSA